jgi:predicted TIM-barrel fold metal-dependent hydrolase
MGADRLLFGCSYPVRIEWLIHGVEFVNSLNVSDEEKKLMLGVDAQKPFKIRNKNIS